MTIQLANIINLIKDLIQDQEKMAKFKEIIADIKELVTDLKELKGLLG